MLSGGISGSDESLVFRLAVFPRASARVGERRNFMSHKFRNVSSFLTPIFAVAIASVALPLPASAQQGNPNPGVLPPHSTAGGLTYGEWSARWFKWAYQPPPASSPVLDTTGANCAVGQSDKVWFLAGTFFISEPPAPVIRHCSIPSGTMLFFPVGNGFCAGDDFPNGFPDERKCATANAKLLSGFRAEVDGHSIQALGGDVENNYYRALSPPFDLVLGSDNIFGAPKGTYSPGAGDGVYVMLTPLTPGQHTIHFHADSSAGGQVDATYHLTVR
jgi:hypothetical protein